jgi:hypothetical protein
MALGGREGRAGGRHRGCADLGGKSYRRCTLGSQGGSPGAEPRRRVLAYLLRERLDSRGSAAERASDLGWS